MKGIRADPDLGAGFVIEDLEGQGFRWVAVTVDDQDPALLNKSSFNGGFKRSVMWTVVTVQKFFAFCFAGRPAQGTPVMGLCVNDAHPTRSHRFQLVIFESFHINDKTRDRGNHCRSRNIGEKLVRVAIGQKEKLTFQFGIRKEERLAVPFRDDHAAVRDVADEVGHQSR